MTQTNDIPLQDQDTPVEGAPVTSDASADGSAAPTPEERIAALEAENATLKTDYLRALADAQNAKRMADKRIEDNSKFAVSNFAKELLAVADNLSRALLAAPSAAREGNEVLRTLAVGVEMTEKELLNALGKYGISKVESLNQPFDPNVHQAMQEVERTDVPTGTVVQVYQDAYLIYDRLLRPAMVIVSRGGPKREAPAATPAQEAGGVDQSV